MKNIWKYLGKPVFASERSRRELRFLKRILLLASAAAISVLALPQGVYMMIFRIDMGEELVAVTKADLLAGPIGALVVFLTIHEYLPKGKARKHAYFFYFFIAFLISAYFLMLHIGQVSFRLGMSPTKILVSLLKGDR